jgi:hypothetical protein
MAQNSFRRYSLLFVFEELPVRLITVVPSKVSKSSSYFAAFCWSAFEKCTYNT